MPAITVAFTAEELAELYAEAEELGVPVERMARKAVCESVARSRRQRCRAGDRVRTGAHGLFEAGLRPSDGEET
ncbi:MULTISPECIES: hypothetical protein [unclassified Streptomyces]|uniref:hypothetical protein n=1 Tax=unclassified Streptomyces TaxID=2593676 RepID=UPI000F73C366|nr:MULTISPECIES: hypothetical protein [unclassified Streptomyces]